MRNICVTGATGFIGRHLLENLSRQQGVNIRALAHRTPDELLPRLNNVIWVRADLGDPRAAGELCLQGGTLIHLAHPPHWPLQTYQECISRLAQAASEQGVRRVIHCSTAVVVGAACDQRIVETTPPQPRNDYEKNKLALESAWLKHALGKFDLAIARPTAVFGPGGKNLLALADALCGGSALINYLRSSVFGRRRMNLVCIQNVVSAIGFLAARDAACGGAAFLISDDDDPLNNFRDVERILKRELGIGNHTLPPVPVPSSVLKMLLRLSGRSNTNPERVYDGSGLRNAGWRSVCRLEQGLREFAAWYKTGRVPR